MNSAKPTRLRANFFSTGTLFLIALIAIGFSFGLARLFNGLASVTNLSNQYPWGIWIAIDVACGVALAAGGFTSAALIEIFGRHKYKPLLRPAILTAWLGYLTVGFSLAFDLGRYWNIWQPMFHWQGNSVLFEVGMCVMAYLFVLTVEMAPGIIEGLKMRIEEREWGFRILSWIEAPLLWGSDLVKAILPLFILAGVVLSCMHQSSLGTLMVIAPTKLSALWYTSYMPLLFLLSAIMVGFPMVIMESVAASRSFRLKPEMEILTPLASRIPIFIGLYGLVRFGDLYFRRNSLDFVENPNATIAFVVEIFIGIILPFVLFMFKEIRKSPGWLFFSSLLVILGVVLNRINVFLVGYNPPFAQQKYFPAIGEIALTISLVAFIMFFYRISIFLFPIISLHENIAAPPKHPLREGAIPPARAWIFRGVGAFFLLSFVLLYTLVHKSAIAETQRSYSEITRVKTAIASPSAGKAATYPFRPAGYRNYYLLNNEVLNAKSDFYGPVRFNHRAHDNFSNGDCHACHHRFSFGGGDRVGEDLGSLHVNMDVSLGGPCSDCHKDMTSNTPQSCAECHGLPNEADDPARIGLKGAYHRQCIGCHEALPGATQAPTDCQTCHHPLIPNHSDLVKLPPNPDATAVTASCLGCHPGVGKDILVTAHWRWGGHTPTLLGHEHQTDIGLLSVVNNYSISKGSNIGECYSCHIGYFLYKGLEALNNPGNIDCLVCHDTTGAYQKNLDMMGLPEEGLDLAEMAAKVGRPSRKNCGACHFYGGGAPNCKHGDLEPALVNPSPEFDVHMGQLDFRCQDCHTTTRHQIAGMSMTAPAMEGRIHCERCHGTNPHGISGYLSRHLDDHVKAVACETCHIPQVAKGDPTLVSIDYSQAGKDRTDKPDLYGKPTYDKKYGTLVWQKNLIPAYRWFDGTRKAYLSGEKINPDAVLVLNLPMGEKRNPAARIFPFKSHTAIQPYDKGSNILGLPKFWDGYWSHFDWNRALTEGMSTAGLAYSGSYGFVKTEMLTGIHHEVVPAKQALGCTDCHDVQAVSCVRCHQKAAGMSQPEHTRKIYPQVRNRMDFRALGYSDDPAYIGGRFYLQLGRGTPPL